LAEDADEFVVHKLAAFKPRLLEPLDLLLHDNFNAAVPTKRAGVDP
jgi:hypothetical protein